jgi:hypothetical protein
MFEYCIAHNPIKRFIGKPKGPDVIVEIDERGFVIQVDAYPVFPALGAPDADLQALPICRIAVFHKFRSKLYSILVFVFKPLPATDIFIEVSDIREKRFAIKPDACSHGNPLNDSVPLSC